MTLDVGSSLDSAEKSLQMKILRKTLLPMLRGPLYSIPYLPMKNASNYLPAAII